MPQTCIQCSTYHPTYTLPYTTYGSTQVLKLSTCHHCHLPVDGYSEYELQLKVIDLVLCRLSVYRHWLVNTAADVQHRMAQRLMLGLVPLYVLCSAWVQHQRATKAHIVLPSTGSASIDVQLTTHLPHTFGAAVAPSLHSPLLMLLSALGQLLVSGLVYVICMRTASGGSTRQSILALQLSSWPYLLYAIFYIYNYHTTYTLIPPLMILCNRIASTTVLLQNSVQQQQTVQTHAAASSDDKQHVLPSSQWYTATMAAATALISWFAGLLTATVIVTACTSLTHTQSMLVTL